MQQRSQETHRRLLEAASRLFIRNGYDVTGVAEICAAAGVSKGAFYHHFPTKQSVFIALLENWLEDLDEQMQKARFSVKGVPASLLEMASRSKQVFQAADGQLPLFLEFWTQASRQPAVWEATIAPYQRYEEMLAGLIAEGVREGSLLQDVDPHMASRVVVGLVMGLLLQALFDPAGAAWDEVTQKGIRMLLNGILG